MEVKKQDPRWYNFAEKFYHQVFGNQEDRLELEIEYLEQRLRDTTGLPDIGPLQDGVPNPSVAPRIPVTLSDPLTMPEIMKKGLGILDVELDRTPLDDWTSERAIGEFGGAEPNRLMASALRTAAGYRPIINNELSPVSYKYPLWPRSLQEWRVVLFPRVSLGAPEIFPISRAWRNFFVWSFTKAIFGRLYRAPPATEPTERDTEILRRWLLQRNFLPDVLMKGLSRRFLPAFINAFVNCDLKFLERCTNEALYQDIAYYMVQFMQHGLYHPEQYIYPHHVKLEHYRFEHEYATAVFIVNFAFDWRRIVKSYEDPDNPVPEYSVDPEKMRFEPNAPGDRDYYKWEGNEVQPEKRSRIRMVLTYSHHDGWIVESISQHFVGIMRYANQYEFLRANKLREPIYGLRGQRKFDILDRVETAREMIRELESDDLEMARRAVLNKLTRNVAPISIQDENPELIAKREKAEEEIRKILQENNIKVPEGIKIRATVPKYSEDDFLDDMSKPDEPWDARAAFREPMWKPPPFKPLFDHLGNPIPENIPHVEDPYEKAEKEKKEHEEHGKENNASSEKENKESSKKENNASSEKEASKN
eukprot:TRINITY_DN3724_c0_g1_i1.p1 TRINITY_DN3724_c0_g1~~TRINITY_DN3724_c0_g1_i1.p1  ORF type:complete len:630 (-),score=165.91 TRINITY_DN3724_c0_g1_i1:55-1824(-)